MNGKWTAWAMALLAAAATLLAPGCGSSHKSLAGPLAGTWHVHTFYLVIASDGRGDFTWPIHLFCGSGVGQGPPPCDTLSPQGQVGDGGHAILTVKTRDGVTATGLVTGSSEPSVVPQGSVQLRLGANDVLYLHFGVAPGVRAFDYVCGPQTDRNKINCGA
jgi:hypothetical protein